jgi:hypothetical protein
MTPTESLLTTFYTAFQQKDFLTMQSCYHTNATFSDPVFQNLNSKEVKAMWQMLLTSSKDLRVEFSNVKADDNAGTCHWEAWYSFSKTKRKVHNVIEARFEFKDGLIYRHIDHFGFRKWARQALGIAGLLPFVQGKVRATARKSLDKFQISDSNQISISYPSGS